MKASVRRAQLSLEFLLVLSAFFSVLLLVLPLMQRAMATAEFAIDARQALSFSRQFGEKAGQLGFLAEQSVFSIEASPMLNWRVSVDGNKLFVRVFSADLEKEKSFETSLPLSSVAFEKSFNQKTIFFLGRKGKTLVVNTDG